MATSTSKAPPQRRTQQERSETTTAEIVAAARYLFARRGYVATSLDAVVERCGVTKGALYHHLPSKQDLFEAVFEDEERRLAGRVAEAQTRKRDAMASALAGVKAFLDAAVEPHVQRILFLDAPGVLGWDRLRTIRTRYSLALVTDAVGALIAEGKVRRRDPSPASHLLYGALLEAAMLIAESENSEAARRGCEREMKRFLASLTE